MRRFVRWLVVLIAMIQGPQAATQTSGYEDTWTTSYVAALAVVALDPSAGCNELHRLAGETAAPIVALARARELFYCPIASPKVAIAELEMMLQDSHLNWLSPLLSESVVAMALAHGDKRALADNASRQLSNLSSQREKEQLLQSAIRAAKDLGMGVRAAELESLLYTVAPRKQLNPAATEWLKVADDFKVNEDWANAKVYYNRLLKVSTLTIAEQLRAWDGIRQVEKARFRKGIGSLTNFLSASEAVSRFSRKQLPKSGLAFAERQSLLEAWVQYARDQWSYGDTAKARSELNKVIGAKYVEDLFKAYAFLFRSRIFAGDNSWPEAAKAANEGTQILTQQLSGSSLWTPWVWTLWDDCFWAEAFASRKAGALQASLASLQWAVTYSKNVNSRAKFRFWIAENEKSLGNSTAAAADWAAVASQDPNGYYGFAARGELGQLITTLPDGDLSDVQQPASVSAVDFAITHWLVRAGEMSMAQKFTRQILSSKSYAVDELSLRAFAGDFSVNWTIFYAQVPVDQRDAFLSNNARLFFPKPYFDLVKIAVAKTSTVDIDYVYSIMRQESGFNPLARSPVNAYGLLQLMPATARRMAPVAGVSFKNDFELFLPRLNIPLGVAFMGELVSQVNGSFILRTIGYNTELAKGEEWKLRFYNGNVYEFIEQIPYEETRSYVRLVIRNYVMNKRLNSTLPFLFPADIMQM